ncbi:MAG: glycosyltransferase family 4 protein [Patescibacteria group bacterium]
MKIVLVTGIYPPDIGGPATYVHNLAREFSEIGIEVVVVTYGGNPKSQNSNPNWEVVRVKKGLPLLRWFSYANALKKVGQDADIVYAFSSVSCGVPLKLVRLKKPKKILRLGGDFGWERYTDFGGKKSLKEWYEKRSAISLLANWLISRLLSTFNHIVFSTHYQQEIYEKHFKKLSAHLVIENALPEGQPQIHAMNTPLRLLFMGRFVAFKNLETFLKAIKKIDARVTMVGEGSKGRDLRKLASPKIIFVSPASGKEKQKIFQSHDLLVIPSLTEISPNVALEARAAGLPVLLTSETGLSSALSSGMILKNLRTVDQIVEAIEDVRAHYSEYAQKAAHALQTRGWEEVAQEHLGLFENCLEP